MLKRLKKQFRHYWHDLYYYLTNKKGVEFAMTCKDATEKIDLADQTKTITDKFRVKLHVSVCQACNNYYSLSQMLRAAIRKVMAAHKDKNSNLDKLNQELVKKYSKH